MAITTTKNIMSYVKDFIIQSDTEEWDTDLMIEKWEETIKDIETIIKEGTPKIKKTSPKDPKKPKRGKSSYIFFCGEARAEVKEDLGDVKPHEVMKELGARWGALKKSSVKSDKIKLVKYTKMAEDDKVRSSQEMETYVPPSDEELLTKNKKTSGSGKSGSGKSGKSGSGKPTRGRTAYIYFCSANRSTVKENNEEVDGKGITKILGKQWAKLKCDKDNKDLQRYQDMATEDKKRYENEMSLFAPILPPPVESVVHNEEKQIIDVAEKKKIMHELFGNGDDAEIDDDETDEAETEIDEAETEEDEMDDTEKKEWVDENQE
jgi:hypothetical protein